MKTLNEKKEASKIKGKGGSNNMNTRKEIEGLKRILDYVSYQLKSLSVSIRLGRMNIEGSKFGSEIKVAKIKVAKRGQKKNKIKGKAQV